jgi:hypothetical protein
VAYQGEKFFRIDLGVVYVPQPCERHKQGGVEGDCEACEETPEKETRLPHLDGFFVEVLNPDLLPYGKRKELYAAVAPLPEVPTPRDRQAHAEALQRRREQIMAGLINAWNLVPVDESQGTSTLPLPKNDPGALDRAPDISEPFWTGLARAQRRARTRLPKALETSSEAS